MLVWLLHQCRHWLADTRLRRATRRYQAQVRVIDGLPLPDDYKRAAKDRALHRVGETLERYTDRP